MILDDFKNFAKAWEQAYICVGAKKPSVETVKYSFNLLMELPIDIVLDGIAYHVKSSEFVVKVANIFDYYRQISGMTPETLKSRALVFYDKYLLNVENADAVIDDDRFAYAFSECFRSISDFMRRPNSDYDVSRDRNMFADMVSNLQTLLVPVEKIPHVFTAQRLYQGSIHVSFFGDSEKCRKYAEAYYQSTGEFEKYRLVFPNPEKTKALPPPPPQENIDMEESKAMMKELMEVLTSKSKN